MSIYRVMLSFTVILSIFMFSDVKAMYLLGLAENDFLAEQGTPPPGANIRSCRPSPEHPNPIVLVPGTFETMDRNWVNLSPILAAEGYCVYSLNYGRTIAGPSTGKIEHSAEELNQFIEKVLEHTGAKKVSIIGHSQGGMMPRYYMKYLGGAKKVDDLIGLTPSNHGTEGAVGLGLTLTATELASCTACVQQKAGSEFLLNLNDGEETIGTISYTVITTKTDEIVVPYTSAFLSGPEKRLMNITLQDYFPLDMTGHLLIANDPNVFSFIFDALEYDGPANPARALLTAR
ncbi:esterase/lipase family protein [Peribacillus sp. SCS-155]|uniref:esterase/lipase family protein n=1 Tax=Peribacillus sedimenti TaxID=3115297 RepID=UPI003905C224